LKVTLESLALTNRGIILESENREEKQILRNIWEQNGRLVSLAKIGHHIEGNLQLVIAPTPEVSELKLYLVTFKDGSVDQVDALGPTQARAIVEVGLRDGTFYGEIESIEKR